MGYIERPKIRGEFRTDAPGSYWLAICTLLFTILAPNIGRLAAALGLRPTYDDLFWATMALGTACIVGIILGYRNAQARARIDTESLRPDKQRKPS